MILAVFVLEYLVCVALHDLHQVLDLAPMEVAGLTMVLAHGVIFSAVMQWRGLAYRDILHPSSTSPKATAALLLPPVVLLVPALVLVMSLLTEGLVQLAPMSRSEEAMFEQLSSGGAASVIAVCILAPLLEEMLFRGIILRGFLAQYPRWQAIMGSALLFGGAHLNLYQFVCAFLIGILAGWLYERSQSLLPGIGLHAAYNTAFTVLDPSWDPAQARDAWQHAPLVWALAAALALLGLFCLRRLLPRPLKAAVG